jgi:hypothetical protein
MTCQSCNGCCPAPQACHQPDPRDVDMSHVFPLERVIRRHPWTVPVFVVVVYLIGAAIDTPQLWSN